MAKQTINIGSGELAGDGESLRSAFDKINDNFDEVYTGSGTTLGSDTTPALGGNLDLSGNDITGIGNLNITGNITATGSISASLAYSNLTSTPTTLAGYGITDAYTQTQVDTAITNATSNIVIQSGSTQSIDVVAADSTVLVDSVNGTLNATTLTGALPAIDGSALTGISATSLNGQAASYYLDFANFTNTPTTLAGYGITDGLQLGTSATTALAGDTALFSGAFADLTGKPTTLAGYGITDALTTGGALTGTGLEAEAVGAGVADGNDLAISGGDATEINSTGGDANITGGSGALTSGNVNIGASQTTLVTIGSGSNNVDFPSGTAVDFSGATVTGLTVTETDPVVGAITGIVKADGSGNISAAVAGTDYLTTVAFADLTGKPTSLGGYGITDAASTGAETTFTKDVHFDRGVEEKFQTLTGQSGVVAHNWNDGHVFYHTTPAGDITANFINVNLTAEYATNVTIIINQGATPYEVTAVQIAGTPQTINWQGGSAPTGTANGIDSFSFTILNDGGSYVVLGQMVDFT